MPIIMTTIDHRILIPVPQAAVWEYLRKLQNNARWQVDCKSVSLLTTKHEGAGTRWRYTSEGGREYVAEIRAWYDGLGYEYSYIDRPPFRSAIGRIRLQEIPEGTIVQWTLEYELGGMLGGVRNALGTARALDNAIAQSLKKLYLQLKTDRARMIDPSIETKSLMQDAPDADARAQYKPRHPTAAPTAAETSKPLKPVRLSIIDEPPLDQDDTRPTRAVAAITEADLATAAYSQDTASRYELPPTAPAMPSVEAGIEHEPDFLASVPDVRPPETPTATGSAVIFSDTEPVKPPLSDMSHAQLIDVSAVERELDSGNDSPPTTPSRQSLMEALAKPEPTKEPVERREIISIPEPASTDSQRLMDTSNMSIWEVFGVPRPSETGEFQAVVVEASASAAQPEPIAPPAPPITLEPPVAALERRVGLRLKLRGKRVRLRIPHQ
ncbi:MAG: SRPBCC family protein [Chloroflexota bacterium]|nr:SRPBCC family protein [Chloroflexota bacterium]